MIRILGIGGMALILAGCSESKAKERVKELLIDPTSAEFSDVHTKGGVTCGFVNAKNRMGGFTGNQVFIVQDGVSEILDGVPSDEFLNDLASNCDKRVFDRFSRTYLNDLRIKAVREVRKEDASN
jgi:hypothetical protein